MPVILWMIHCGLCSVRLRDGILGVYLTGVHFMDVHLIGVYLMGVQAGRFWGRWVDFRAGGRRYICISLMEVVFPTPGGLLSNPLMEHVPERCARLTVGENNPPLFASDEVVEDCFWRLHYAGFCQSLDNMRLFLETAVSLLGFCRSPLGPM